MKTQRAFARQNAYGYWEGCIEYPSGVVSGVTNAKHTKDAALAIAQRIVEGSDERSCNLSATIRNPQQRETP